MKVFFFQYVVEEIVFKNEASANERMKCNGSRGSITEDEEEHFLSLSFFFSISVIDCIRLHGVHSEVTCSDFHLCLKMDTRRNGD